jgi:hypothetical protein
MEDRRWKNACLALTKFSLGHLSAQPVSFRVALSGLGRSCLHDFLSHVHTGVDSRHGKKGFPSFPANKSINTLLTSELLYDWQFTANQFVLARSPLRLNTSNFIFKLNDCGYNLYVTSSLMKGWVCRLYKEFVNLTRCFSNCHVTGRLCGLFLIIFELKSWVSQARSYVWKI